MTLRAFWVAGFLLLGSAARSADLIDVQELSEAAESGDVKAQNRLCQYYWQNARGSASAYKKALSFCRMAADEGHPGAMTLLGIMYAKGQGVVRNREKAVILFRRASEKGVLRADHELGMMLRLTNREKAQEYFCRAALAGLELSKPYCAQTQTLDSFASRGYDNKIDFKRNPLSGPSPIATDEGLSVPENALPSRKEAPPPEIEMIRRLTESIPRIPKPGSEPESPRPERGASPDVLSMRPHIPSAGASGPAAPPARPLPAARFNAMNSAPATAGPRPEPSPLSSLPLIPAAATLLALLPLYGGYRLWRSGSRGRLAERVRTLVNVEPRPHRDISHAYLSYCGRGGSAEDFSCQELLAVAASLDECGRHFPTPGLTVPKALELAGCLAADGRVHRVQDVFSEAVLATAAKAGQTADVVGVLSKSGNLDSFMAHFAGPGRSHDFYSAYAAGLARSGKVAEALRMISAKPLETFTADDQALLLELHVKLGHFDQASLLMSKVAETRPAGVAKDYFEDLAKAASAKGEERLAGALRTMAAGKVPPPQTAKPAVAPGRTLSGKYELRQLISSGGMGEVYEGYDRSLERRVAVKRMLPGLLTDPAMRDQFLREAKTAAHLTHPYIVPIYESLENGGDLYLVFEFVKGETLAALLMRRSRLTLKECRGLMHYVCHAVDYAHRKHVLHRDLKPGNIMLDENGIARVMDFGIAIEITGTLSATFVDRQGVCGTLRYMPPEQHYGKTSRPSDVYSLGVCLYEMATGYLPFNASTVPDVLAQKHKADFAPPSFHVPELPPAFDELIKKSLAPDPKQRVQSAVELYEALGRIPA